MKTFDKFIDAALMVYKIIGAVCVCLMMLHITADVFAKYALNRPLPGTIPIVSQFYMVIIAFLPLAFVERESGHIDVEIIATKLPMSVQRVLYVFAGLMGIAVYGLLTWRTWLEAMKKFDVGTFSYEQGVKIPTWPSYFILPFGTALTLIVIVSKLRARPQHHDDVRVETYSESIK